MHFLPDATQLDCEHKQVRSRYLLPMEMLLYVVMLIAAVHGFLLETITGRAGVWWILGLGITGGVGFHVAVIEWCHGFGWNNVQLRRWVYLRKWLSSISIAVWAYVVNELLGLEEGGRMAVLFLGVIAVVPFHAWSWYVNFRTWAVLNPHYSTRKLEATLATNRLRW